MSTVCNPELRILVVDARFPGSCHDSWMGTHNPLRARLAAQLQPGEYLLARIVYACVALHNIALDAGDWTLDECSWDVQPAADPDEPEEPGESQVLEPHDVLLRGRQQRSAVVALFGRAQERGSVVAGVVYCFPPPFLPHIDSLVRRPFVVERVRQLLPEASPVGEGEMRPPLDSSRNELGMLFHEGQYDFALAFGNARSPSS
ncbi:hypothetical protein HPB52_009385 [Rhipicephalus sanguineus]|uniref:Uncharacterized protein n=1 Tax=Rhipicephalus sanguineus TaxID=34632 RepID=A0A9D4PIU5_RHISA|nr:hypothetical protein HPB52_009385 [Rhipicephalus sanguineus]